MQQHHRSCDGHMTHPSVAGSVIDQSIVERERVDLVVRGNGDQRELASHVVRTVQQTSHVIQRCTYTSEN